MKVLWKEKFVWKLVWWKDFSKNVSVSKPATQQQTFNILFQLIPSISKSLQMLSNQKSKVQEVQCKSQTKWLLLAPKSSFMFVWSLYIYVALSSLSHVLFCFMRFMICLKLFHTIKSFDINLQFNFFLTDSFSCFSQGVWHHWILSRV